MGAWESNTTIAVMTLVIGAMEFTDGVGVLAKSCFGHQVKHQCVSRSQKSSLGPACPGASGFLLGNKQEKIKGVSGLR